MNIKQIQLENIKNILTSILIILIPNIAMSLLAYWTHTERLLINIDYFIPLLFLAWRQRILFSIAFITISLFDFLVIFSQLFPFIRISDLFYLSKFAFISSRSYQLYTAVLILLIALQNYFFLKKYNPRYNKSLLILFNIIIFYYAFNINFFDKSDGKFWQPDKEQLIASQLVNNIDYRSKGFVETYAMEGDAFQSVNVNSATADLLGEISSLNKVLLIVNESWGVPANGKIQEDILSPLFNNTVAIQIKRSTLDFEGFTIAGELRELCNKAPIHFNLKNQTTGFEDCLPEKYSELGYNTVAVHGALGLMYDRQYWYPRAGFQQMLFRDQGLNLPNSRCYSFPGNCDSDIAEKVIEQFDNNDKLFLYWLTLNTHSIYDMRDLKTDLFDCAKYNIEINTATCRNLKLQKQFFYTLSDMLEQPSLSGTQVIVVGDHEPPIILGEENVFIPSKVPAIKFEVR